MKVFKTLIILLFPIICKAQVNSNWTLVHNASSTVHHMTFRDSLVGYALSDSNLIRTSDGGDSWNVDTTFSSSNQYLSLNILGSNFYIVIEDSSNQLIINKLDSNYSLVKSYYQFIDREFLIYMKGNNSLIGINSSTDNSIYCFCNDSLIEILDKSNIVGTFVGINKPYLAASTRDSIFLSDDEGQSWRKIAHSGPMLATYHQVFYGGGNTLYFHQKTFPSNSLVSYNSGQTWQPWTIGPIAPVKYFKVDSSKYLGIDLNRNYFYMSDNQGSTFNRDTLQSIISDLYIKSDSVVFAMGYYGEIYKSSNLGGLVGLRKNVSMSAKEIIELFPNPTSGDIQVNLNTSKKVDEMVITNSLGQRILFFDSYQKEISLRGHARGIYYVTVKIGNKSLTKKLILE